MQSRPCQRHVNTRPSRHARSRNAPTPPATGKPGIDRMVDELERHAPRMLAAYADKSGFWSWFAGEAASIGSIARSRNDWLYARDRLSQILERLSEE